MNSKLTCENFSKHAVLPINEISLNFFLFFL